jgi:endonuclease-8
MPEGPEIRRAADRLGRALAGRVATNVAFAFPALRRWEKRLTGQRIDAVDAWGKAMLIRFEQGQVVFSHNQLYGFWRVVAPGARPTTRRQLRLAIDVAEHSALLYSASEIAVLRGDRLWDHPYLARLGPDVLSKSLAVDDVAGRLADPRFRDRSLGALLLDQGFLAGVGNYLRSEILFAARLHPDRRPRDLDPDELRRFAGAVRQVARRAYRQSGVTVPTESYRRHQARGERRGTARFAVFARDGAPCRACGTRVERVERGSRRLYLCAVCQPGARA